MSRRDDDDASTTGVPERADAGHITESGRHVNRNVVPRSGLPSERSETSGLRDLRELYGPAGRGQDADDPFDLVTPVRPQPRDIFEEEDATLWHGGQPPPGRDAEADAPTRGSRGPRIMPLDAGFTPPELRRPGTDRMHLEPQGEAPSDEDTPFAPPAHGTPPVVRSAQLPAFTGARDRAPRSTPDPGFIPPESRRPSTERPVPESEALDPRRPATVRGHVEPRRRPTAPITAAGGEAGEAARRASRPFSVPPEPADYDPTGRETPRVRSGRPTPTASLSPYERGHTPYPTPPAPRTSARSTPAPPLPTPGAAAPALATGLTAPAGSRDETEPGRIVAPSRFDAVLRGATIVVGLGLGAVGFAQPASVLTGGAAWLGFLFFVLGGWGMIVARLARTSDPDAGLRMALGAAGYVAVAGPLIAAGLLTRPVICALLAVGFAGFAWREATAPIAGWQRVRDAWRFVRTRPALGVFIAALVALACVRMLGGAAELDRNPWDDDLAYTPFVKRLLDTGDLIEPFSFRRLGAYGGQTALAALAAARGSLAGVHLLDKGLALGVALLVMLGHARDRRTQPLWLALIALAILVMPDAAINTASQWTGVLCFLALYRLVVHARWPLVGLVAAATCTLRQNFLAVVVVFVAAVLAIRLIALARKMPARAAWHQERRGWALAGGVGLAVIAPWWIAQLLSSHTFLFPIVSGTWNHELSLAPAATTWPQVLAFALTAALDATPVVVIPILAVVAVFAGDHRPGRPLTALLLASALGFALLALGLVGSEVYNLWRYAFGFAIALTVVLVLEVGAEDDGRVSLAPLGRWLLLAALVLQIASVRGPLIKQAVAIFHDIREARAIDRRGDPSALAEQRRYTAMQAALPPGGRTVVMLDDPAMLDYRRNPIANLDVPGFASPGDQLPAFAGAEPLRAYLVAAGYRYAAFVRSERSRYHFRRTHWVRRMFTDAELFQILGTYTVDMIDSLAELATTTRVLYDDDGLVVLDLATPQRDASRRPVAGDEPTRRGAWVRALADREGLHDAWSLTTRADLRFEDGFGTLRFPEAGRPAILPLSRRAHLRVRSAGPGAPSDMQLVIRAAIEPTTVFTRPRIDVSIDGELLTSAVADAAGRYTISVTVPRSRLTGDWHDLYLVFSSFAEPGRDVRDLRIARLESVEWSPP